MRLSRFVPLVLSAVALGACSEPSDDPVTPNTPPLAYVRYINAVPDTLNTTLRFIDQVAYSPMTFVNVPFRGLGQGNYQPTQAGARKFRVFTTETSDPAVAYSPAANTLLVDTTITFEAGKYYTLLHSGFARAGSTPRQRIVSIEDVFPAVTGANIAIRAIHQAFGAGAVDLHAAATPTTALSATTRLVPNFAEQAVSPYVTAPAGTLAAAVTAPGSTTALVAAAAPAGTAGTASVDPIGGAAVGGTVITAIAFPATPANKGLGAKFAAPGIVYFVDKQPPRTVNP